MTVNDMDNDINTNKTQSSQPYIPPQIPKKSHVKGDLFDLVAVVVNFVLFYSFLANVLNTYSIKSTVSYLCIFAFATAYIVSKTKVFSKQAILPGAACVLLSFGLFTGNDYILIIPGLIYFSGSYCVKLTNSAQSGDGTFFWLLDILYGEVFVPFSKFVEPYISSLEFLQSRKKKGKNNNKALWIILGAVIAGLCLICIVPLLMKSDLAFADTFNGLADSFEKFFSELDFYFDSLETGSYLLLTAIFAPYVLAVMFSFRHGLNKNATVNRSAKYRKLRVAPNSFFAAFLSVISAIYLVYLVVQFSYVFSAFSGHLPSGTKITVIQYARSGFFETVAIAAINFVIIACVAGFAKRKDNLIPKVQKFLCVFLSAFTVFISFSSIAKIILYMNRYGLTQKRIFAFCADIVLVFAFVAIIIKLFRPSFKYFRMMLLPASIIFVALMVITPSNIIVEYNCNAYLSGKIKTVDFEDLYLTEMSLKTIDKVAETGHKEAMENRKDIIYDFVDFSIADACSKIKYDSDYDSYLEKSDEELVQNLRQYLNKGFLSNNFSTLTAICNAKELRDNFDHYLPVIKEVISEKKLLVRSISE